MEQVTHHKLMAADPVSFASFLIERKQHCELPNRSHHICSETSCPTAVSRRLVRTTKRSLDNNRPGRPVPTAKGRFRARFGLLNLHTNCPGCIRVGDLIPLRKKEEGAMKALALLTAAAVTLFSVA
ncbi:MAG: hypothetical protein WAV38_11500, partial [Xanthobacteraceae bacterium]